MGSEERTLKKEEEDAEESLRASFRQEDIMTEFSRYARSRRVTNPRVNMFQLPQTDMSIKATRELPISPSTPSIEPIHFEFESQGFLDLDRSYVELELRIMKSDGNAMVIGDVMVLANNLAHTLFKQIDVRLNGTLITPQSALYHQQAFIETLLNNDKEDVDTLLVPQFYYDALDVPDDGEPDEFTANSLDDATPHAAYTALSDSHKAVVAARRVFLGGVRVTLRFTPSLEVFRLGRLLRPNVQVQMDMYLNPPSMWTIRHNGAATLRMTQDDLKARLIVKQVSLEDSVETTLRKKYLTGVKSVYPTVRGEVRSFVHPANSRNFECQNPFGKVIPNRLVIAMTKQTANNGEVTVNPFNYGLFNMSSIKTLVGGEEYPYQTLQVNHNNGLKDRVMFHRFLEASGCMTRGTGNLIERKDYGHGKKANLIVFDLTANQHPDSPVLNPELKGDLRIKIDFGANPPENLTVLVYGEFENVMEITGPGVVSYNVHE